jgi:hypothetical protein
VISITMLLPPHSLNDFHIWLKSTWMRNDTMTTPLHIGWGTRPTWNASHILSR